MTFELTTLDPGRVRGQEKVNNDGETGVSMMTSNRYAWLSTSVWRDFTASSSPLSQAVDTKGKVS